MYKKIIMASMLTIGLAGQGHTTEITDEYIQTLKNMDDHQVVVEILGKQIRKLYKTRSSLMKRYNDDQHNEKTLRVIDTLDTKMKELSDKQNQVYEHLVKITDEELGPRKEREVLS